MIKEKIKFFAPPVCHPWWKNLLIGLGVFLVLALMLFGGVMAYAQVYKDKIYPGVYVGTHSFGRMTEAEAKEFVENFNNRLTKESLDFYFYRFSGNTLQGGGQKNGIRQSFKFNN